MGSIAIAEAIREIKGTTWKATHSIVPASVVLADCRIDHGSPQGMLDGPGRTPGRYGFNHVRHGPVSGQARFVPRRRRSAILQGSYTSSEQT